MIKSAADTLPEDIPILALSYQYLSSGDSFRNGKCALLPTEAEQIECLLEQHEDAITGGDYGATHFKSDGSAFWGEVLPENALKSRLGDLLVYLDSLYPTEGWDAFYNTKGFPKWRKIIVSGHSQGAGHAAYLAMKFKTRGTIMISGPQDECIVSVHLFIIFRMLVLFLLTVEQFIYIYVSQPFIRRHTFTCHIFIHKNVVDTSIRVVQAHFGLMKALTILWALILRWLMETNLWLVL